MDPIKKLASQTAIYGISNILGRFLNYLLLPLYTHAFSTAEYGVVAEFYAYSGFLGVLLLFGFETGFLRFFQKSPDREKVYATTLNFIIAANAVFLVLVVAFTSPLAHAMHYDQHHEYFYWFACILVFDSITQIPLARLRSENKALRFAGIRTAEIVVTVLLNIFFIVVCRHAFEHSPASLPARLYDPAIGPGYIFISNLIASTLKFIYLLPMLGAFRTGPDRALLGRMFRYSMPLVVISLAAMTNEMLDRAILKFLLPFDLHTNMAQLGIYSACYKLSLIMTLFIQSFRYAAEPFFMSHASEKKPQAVFAVVMKYFVIVCSAIFLFVTLYLDVFKHFIGADFREGLHIVPVLLMANIWLGIYINLSVWYKLTDRTGLGALVSVGGALITIAMNVLLVPIYGYTASAWTTLACYASMAIASYWLGRKYYPVPYDLLSLLKYMGLSMAIYLCFRRMSGHSLWGLHWPPFALSTVFMILFLVIAWYQDGRQLMRSSDAETAG